MLVDAGYRWELAFTPYASNRGRIKCFDGRRIEERPFQDFGVLVVPAIHLWAHRRPKQEIEAVKTFVRNGGGALFLGRSFDRYGNWNVLRESNIRDTADLILDSAHCVDNEPYYVTYTDIASHPATRGVRVFQSRGGSHIQAGEGCRALIRAPEGAVTRSGKVKAPSICVVRKYGRGRVAVMGDDRWLDPEFLKQADNSKLWMGLVNWLAGRRADGKAVRQ